MGSLAAGRRQRTDAHPLCRRWAFPFQCCLSVYTLFATGSDNCPATCYGYTCDLWVADGYTCAQLQQGYGCDCAGCSSCHHTCATAGTTFDRQDTALRALYAATSGSQWAVTTNWLNSSMSHDLWYGIKCNAAGELVSLGLYSNKLTGTIPTALGDLSSLQKL